MEETMIIYACSDLHVKPDYISDKVKLFLAQAAERQADYTLFCGDTFEGTHTGLKDSVLSANGKEMLELIVRQRNPILILGNHDWTLKQVLADPQVKGDPDIQELLGQKPIQVVKNYPIPLGGRTLHFTHGWAEYDRPFGWLAPVYHRVIPVLAWVSSVMNKLSNKRMEVRATDILNALSPGRMKARIPKEGGARSGFWEWWYLRRERGAATRAILDARRNGYIPIWGHTHRRQIDFFERWLAINCGDFVQDEIGGIVIEEDKVKLWERDGFSASFELPES
jgi:UDP-2,3-diacylglucosamine pyrophosphatase LpxH